MEVNPKLGIALVGLGRYSEGQLGPALKETQHCYLAGVVSGDAAKRGKWKSKYDLRDANLYDYQNFDAIKDNPAIEIVYVVLPNAMHAEYVIRAAEAGKHVICEKPMATSVADCHRMIDACNAAGVKLSVGYRLHFDPYNQEVMRLGQQEIFGPVTKVLADDSMNIEKHEWRLEGPLAGGGPLMNNGIYCVQAALYITGELPVAVRAEFFPVTNPSRFSTVEEGIGWSMEFPSGKKALCESSYVKDGNLIRVEAAQGWFELEPAYEYKGLKGRTSEGPIEFPTINQQAAQMDDFALCVKNNTTSKVPGEMGLRDVEILMAIYESARTGERVELNMDAYKTLIEV
ncbi:MAG TPA: Gfo/Idh/MocA family oxidoreductase [Ohtaekwangia sp.]|nr:Gfo/Idh/MocA family oxidoreductase [Ohtaekwangia sp.]